VTTFSDAISAMITPFFSDDCFFCLMRGYENWMKKKIIVTQITTSRQREASALAMQRTLAQSRGSWQTPSMPSKTLRKQGNHSKMYLTLNRQVI
jgi:hypothetical protein